MTAAAWSPVADGLFERDGAGIRLIAARRVGTDQLSFPAPQSERRSGDLVRLPAEGRLWAWTVQRFRPKPPFDGSDGPDGFQPYAVGYVDFDAGIVIEGRLLVDDFSRLRLGIPMRCVADIYRTDEDGAQVATYAFTPSGDA